MDHIEKKAADVLVVSRSRSARFEMRAVVSKLGYSNVDTGESMTDARRFLKSRDSGWIILPVFSTEKDHALSLLRTISSNFKLSRFRVTLLVDNDERQVLPEAFELGLLSWIKLPFNADLFKSELEALLALSKRFSSDSAFVSAACFRAYLSEIKDYSGILRLESCLLQLNPECERTYLNIARAHLSLKHKERARFFFRQALAKDDSLNQEIEDFLSKSGSLGLEILDSLNFKTCLLVDSDEDVTATLKEVLEGEFQVTEVAVFKDGEQAWRHIADGWVPDLLITEWKLKKLGGAELIQRIRNRKDGHFPIVIASSLVDKSDAAILREMYVAEVISKPLQKANIKNIINKVRTQETAPSEALSLEQKIIYALSKKDFSSARNYKDQYQILEARQPGRMEYLEAEFYFAMNRYKDALAKAVLSVKIMGRESLASLNLLGKCMLHMNDLAGAVKCFEKAQSLSPKNIARLCQIADVQSDLGDVENARSNLEKAKEMDGSSEVVKATEVKVSMTAGDSKQTKDLVEQLGSVKELVSQMNNRAVIYIRSNDFAKGEKIYLETLESLPDSEKELKAKVLYNLGLAKARQGELGKSKEWLSQASKLGSGSIKTKINSLGNKVVASIKSGKSLDLSSSDLEIEVSEEEAQVFQGEIDEGSFVGEDNRVARLPERSGICLFKIFTRPD